nr:histidine ammonia-lyase [Raoultella sp. NCTC 9187]
MKTLTLIPGQLSLTQLRDIYSHPLNVVLDERAFAAIDESVACVNAILAEGRTAYGINTGFGLLAQTRISTDDLENLQRLAGALPTPLVSASRWMKRWARLIMVLKINSLSRGFFRHSSERDPGAGGAGEQRRYAVDPGERLGGGIRRSGTAGAYVADAAGGRESPLAG